MKGNLNFEQIETKKLLSKFDFEFFLKQNISKSEYTKSDIETIYKSFEETFRKINTVRKENKKQFNLFSEGNVRKMFTGGFLPALFGLDETREQTFIDFLAVGENWAYFKTWQNSYRNKLTREKIWDILVKTGSLLAIILSIIKFFEYFKK